MIHVGWGKVILLGEHSVVYGYPALAAALDRGVTANVLPTPAGGPLRLDVPVWELAVTADDEDATGRAFAALADAVGLGRPAVTVVADAQVPSRAGLGSSAALAVAVSRALFHYLGKKPTLVEIMEAANASEKIHHGTPSGIDVAVAASGGFGVFRRSSGLRAMAAPPLKLLVAPSGQPRSTKAMVEKVAEATAGSPEDPRLRELGALCDTGGTALMRKDLAGLGAAMDRAHAILADLGVSTMVLENLVAAARKAGAYGAKLTGAGGGGSIIALVPPDKEHAVLDAWKAYGVTGFSTLVGRS